MRATVRFFWIEAADVERDLDIGAVVMAARDDRVHLTEPTLFQEGFITCVANEHLSPALLDEIDPLLARGQGHDRDILPQVKQQGRHPVADIPKAANHHFGHWTYVIRDRGPNAPSFRFVPSCLERPPRIRKRRLRPHP